MSFIIALIEKLKKNILLSSVIGILFTGGIGFGSYYLFIRSPDNTVQKESEEDKKEVVNEEITPKEEKTENEENNQEIEIQEEEEENTEEIKPTFLLDYTKTVLGFQIIFECLFLIIFLWFFKSNNEALKELNVFTNNDLNNFAIGQIFFLAIPFKVLKGNFIYIFVFYMSLYFFCHCIVSFILPLIAAFTSGNDYLSLLKKYGIKRDKFKCRLIMTCGILFVPIVIIYAACWHGRLVLNKSANNNRKKKIRKKITKKLMI